MILDEEKPNIRRATVTSNADKKLKFKVPGKFDEKVMLGNQLLELACLKLLEQAQSLHKDTREIVNLEVQNQESVQKILSEIVVHTKGVLSSLPTRFDSSDERLRAMWDVDQAGEGLIPPGAPKFCKENGVLEAGETRNNLDGKVE